MPTGRSAALLATSLVILASALSGCTSTSSSTPAGGPVSWRDGCKVPAEGDIYATQKRVPTAFSDLTTKAPSLEQYVVCTWNQSADSGELLATVAQLDLKQGWSLPLDALSSDGWEICAVQGKSWFMTLNGDLTDVLQVAYLPDLSAAEIQTFGPLSTCTAGD